MYLNEKLHWQIEATLCGQAMQIEAT